MRIGIDLLGSDTSPQLLLAAVLDFSQALKSPTRLCLFGTKTLFDSKNFPSSVSCVTVEEIITMEDDPLSAIRHKKGASICVGMRMLKKGELSAFVSAGNTGALIASATTSLSTLPGIARPALLTLLPTRHKEIAVLDVGANVSFKVEHLLQFASMGIAYQKSRGIPHPTVGLLNIGSEAKKGTPELREAYQKLQLLNQNSPSPIFTGNIEGKDVFKGQIDVLVTDGFTGNIFLKTAEGIASFILDELQQTAAEDCSPHLKGALATLRHRLHYAEYPGAILCGVEGIVIKCHGDSSPQALTNSIKGAIRLVEHAFLEKIKAELSIFLEKDRTFT